MNEEFKFNFSNDIMDVMMTATNICIELGEGEVSALDFILSTLTYSEHELFEYLLNEGYLNNSTPEVILQNIEADKVTYEVLTGKRYEDFLNAKRNVGKELTIVVKDEENKELQNLKALTTNFDLYLGNADEMYNAFDDAIEICKNKGQDFLDLDTLVYAVLQQDDNTAMNFLNLFFEGNKAMAYMKKAVGVKSRKKNSKEKVIPKELTSYITDLTVELAKKGDCDILNRDDEILQVWNILSKKTKRNAVLIGEPGVGKTAVVEAITHSIISKKCPREFLNYTVLELNLNNMVAGTKYRGEFEERVNTLIDFVKNQTKLIVFVDEIHQILGTGNASNSGPDLAGCLKPVLARDDVLFIGATTKKEYEERFAIDGALSRRFEVVEIKEPKMSEVKSMIASRIEKLSKYHKVNCSSEMLDSVIATARVFSSIANPDATIDLLDRSLAFAKMSNDTELQMKHVKKVFKKNFEVFEKTPKDEKYKTALHEAGHFVAWLISDTKFNTNCTVISIIPAMYWAGVTCFEDEDIRKHSKDLKLLKESIGMSLAGRIAQKFSGKDELDAGASSDLQHATSQAEEYLLKYGMDEEFLNISFETEARHGLLSISDKTSDKIREKASKIVNEVYDAMTKKLEENKEGIKRVADLLMKKGIVTAEEAKNAFYAEKKNKKEEKVLN